MMISRVLRYCCAALALCVGSVAFADSGVGFGASKYFGYQVASAFSEGGKYGHDVALHEARQAQMANASCSQSVSVAGLLKDSHGFLQAAADEVAKGTTGSTVELNLS